jgi:uncharacterized protein (DUF2384 family)
MATAPKPRVKSPAPHAPQVDPVASARALANYRALVARTVEAFGDEIKASKWLSLPNKDLKGLTPLQLAQANGYSTQSLEPILTRIEHGIYF